MAPAKPTEVFEPTARQEGTVERKPQPRLKYINRQQQLLHPIDVERLVEADHPVRAIWELVGRMNLEGYYESIGAVEGAAGREAFDPQLLISVWIYAYSQKVGSAREIALPLRSSLSMVDGTGSGELSHSVGLSSRASRGAGSAVCAGVGSVEPGGMGSFGTGDA